MDNQWLIDNQWIFPVLNLLKIGVFIAIVVVIAIVLIRAKRKRRERTKELFNQMINPDNNSYSDEKNK